jgi:hypothetical protein
MYRLYQNSIGFIFLGFILMTASCSKEEMPDLSDFMGTYEVSEGGCTGTQPKSASYELTVNFKGSDRSIIEIRNLWDDPQNVVEASISGFNFTIEVQPFKQFSTEGIISGQGTFSSSGISITSTLEAARGTPYSCTMTGPKK